MDKDALDRYITGNYGEDQFKNDYYHLCPYHQDSLSWDSCSDDFEECEVELARKEVNDGTK